MDPPPYPLPPYSENVGLKQKNDQEMSDLRNIDFGFVGAEGALSPTLNEGKPIF